jgi:hypothetical protein
MIDMDHALIGKPSFARVFPAKQDLKSPRLNLFENEARFSMCLRLLLRMTSVSNQTVQTCLPLPMQLYFLKPPLPLFFLGRMESKPSMKLRSLKVFV